MINLSAFSPPILPKNQNIKQLVEEYKIKELEKVSTAIASLEEKKRKILESINELDKDEIPVESPEFLTCNKEIEQKIGEIRDIEERIGLINRVAGGNASLLIQEKLDYFRKRREEIEKEKKNVVEKLDAYQNFNQLIVKICGLIY